MPRLLRVLTALPQYALMRFVIFPLALPLLSCHTGETRKKALPHSAPCFCPATRGKRGKTHCRIALPLFPADTENVIRPLPLGSPCFSARRTVLFFSPRRPRFFRVVRPPRRFALPAWAVRVFRPPRRLAHSRAKVFVPAFRACRVRRAVLTFPLLRSAFYVSFAEDVYCCKKCGKKGRRKLPRRMVCLL